MGNLWEEKNGIFQVSPGAEIGRTIREAIERAHRESRSLAFEFNGVIVTVAADSSPDLIYRDWHRALSGYIDKAVGPYPTPELSDVERAHDAAVEAANEERRRIAQAEYDARAKAKREATAARLAHAPAMEFSNSAAWQSFEVANPDGYGRAVVEYAEQWARLMQLELASGRALEAIAEPTSRDADTDAITGFMYGCAVSMLAQCWIHGEQLRRWHNLKTQLHDEGARANASGGVLNPALLNLG